MASMKHNKKRSSGIVYELLVRKMGSQMIDKDQPGCKKTITLFENYFSSNVPIGLELDLFRIIKNTRGTSEATARKVLGEVMREASKMDYRLLDIKKSNLIKEIHHSFGQEFFSKFRIPEYRLLASIQLFIDSCRPGGRLAENVQRIHIEDALVRYMTAEESVQTNAPVVAEMDFLVARLAQKKFREKYGNSLNESQKRVLNEYSRFLFTDNPGVLRKVLAKDKARVLSTIDESYMTKEVKEDLVMQKRLTEAREILQKMDVGRVNEDVVQEMMLYHKLCEELESK